jgi:hypothetical protein
MKKSNTLFNERRENLFKENIPAFSVQGKSRSISVLQNTFIPGIWEGELNFFFYKLIKRRGPVIKQTAEMPLHGNSSFCV